MEVTQYRIAKSISVPQRRIGEIVKGARSITADTALRLGRFLEWRRNFGLIYIRDTIFWLRNRSYPIAWTKKWFRMPRKQATARSNKALEQTLDPAVPLVVAKEASASSAAQPGR